MRLREIKISGLYGYIDKQITFHPDINLLVGINGSGKTSVLNLISWMLNPASLADLCVTQFREISLGLTFKKFNYKLVCKQQGRRMTYRIFREGAGSRAFNPLEILLLAPPESLATRPDVRKHVIEQYRSLKPNEKEIKSYTFLQEIPKAVILGLERTVTLQMKDARQNVPTSSIEQVQEIANLNYSKYQSRMNTLHNRLRNQFMLSAFNVSHFKKVGKYAPVELPQIERWRDRFGKYMEQSPASSAAISRELREAAKLYFNKLESLLDQKHTQTGLVLLSTESQKLRRLINHLEKFDADSEEAYEPIKSYLETINGFFTDSSKQLLFKPETNIICFQVLDKSNKPVGNLRNVELLSSGERQLLTLFTFIKFSRGGIYIIDEPELSLHPKWQDGFLEAIKTLMPSDTQLILATHSPAIVGKNRHYCTTLLPYNG